MRHDRGAVVLVSQFDCLGRRQSFRDGRLGRVGPHDQEVALRRRYLDAGDDDRPSGVGPVAVVVVGDRESVDVATAGDSVEQSCPERVERRRSRPEAVEEPGVSVKVDDVHSLHDGADTLLRSDRLKK